MKKHTYKIVFLSLALALGATACSFSLAQDIKPPPGYQAPVYEEPQLLTGVYPVQAPDLENGAAIYQEKCLPCHGDTGLGDGPDSTGLPVEVAPIGNPSLADAASPLEWYTIVYQGNMDRFMPPFSGSLTEQDVWDVVSYVYSLSTDQNLAAEGASIYEDTCASCHGLEGESPVAPGAFDFTDSEQLAAFSLEDIIQKVSTGGENPDHVFSAVLDAAQQKAVAVYLRDQILPGAGQPVEVAAGEITEPGADEPLPTEVAVEPGSQDTAEQPSDSQDASLGKVTGVVVNGSGGDLPENLEVTLEVYQSFEVLYTDTVPAQEDGSFEFDDVVFDPELIYITVVELNGTFYPSDFQMGSDITGDAIDLPITIYDVTNATDKLSVSRLHVFFQFTDQGTVQVVHQVSISNFGDLMVAPEQDSAPVLNFTLPEGATNLLFETGTLGNPYVKTAAGFGDPTPVLPGSNTYDALFAYELPYDGKLEWVLPLDLPTDIAVIFVQGDEVKLESGTLEPSGSEALDTEVYQVFVANALSRGQELDLTISGGFSFLGKLGLDGSGLTILLGVIGLALAGFGAWRFFRPTEELEYTEDSQDELVDEVMDDIVELDEAFVAGEIDEQNYQARRNSLKAKLKRLLDQQEAE
jgi:mono/diheme cytochrome c family protein